jgi:four helix bundle protein
MNNKEFSRMLESRTKAFAVKIIRFSALLPISVEGKVLRNQLTKAGTSIGANYREANRVRRKIGKNLNTSNSSHFSHFSSL